MAPLPATAAEFQRAVREYYAASAQEYDRSHYDEVSAPFVRDYFCRVARGGKILDVGAGTGRVSEWLGEQVLALDLSIELLAEGRRSGRFRGSVICGEAVRLPLADRSVPVVSAVNILHHCFDPQPVVEEMARVAARDLLIIDAVGWLSHVKDVYNRAIHGVDPASTRIYFLPGDGYCTKAQLWRLAGVLQRGGFRLRIFPLRVYGMEMEVDAKRARWLRLLPWRLARSVLLHATRA